MANSVIEYGVMRHSHGIELVNLDALDLLKVEIINWWLIIY